MEEVYVVRLPQLTMDGRTYVAGEALPGRVGSFEPGRDQNHWCRRHEGPLVACGACGSLFAGERGLRAHTALAHGERRERDRALPHGMVREADDARRGAAVALREAREAHDAALRSLSSYRARHKPSTDPHYAYEVAQREALVGEREDDLRRAEAADAVARRNYSEAFAAALDGRAQMEEVR